MSCEEALSNSHSYPYRYLLSLLALRSSPGSEYAVTGDGVRENRRGRRGGGDGLGPVSGILIVLCFFATFCPWALIVPYNLGYQYARWRS